MMRRSDDVASIAVDFLFHDGGLRFDDSCLRGRLRPRLALQEEVVAVGQLEAGLEGSVVERRGVDVEG